MGQPFIAVGCGAEARITGGKVRTRVKADDEEPKWRPIAEVRAPNGAGKPGICSGFPRGDVPNWYPPALHGGAAPPFQRPATCTADGGYYEFASEAATLRLCYKYQFGRVKATSVDAPCGIPLGEVDVLLSYAPRKQIVRDIPKLDEAHGAWNRRTRVASVDGIYQSTFIPQLKHAFRRRGLPEPDQSYPRAAPQKCDKHDLHFAHPGIPDFAAKAWLSYVASGLAP